MKNPFPDTIAFRASALLIIGLTLTHLVSNLFYTTNRETSLLSAGGEHAIQWVATVGTFASSVSENDLADILTRGNTNSRFVQIKNQPMAALEADHGWREEALQQELARHVSPERLQDYRISYVTRNDAVSNHTDIQDYFTQDDGSLPEEFILVSLNLGNGRWLNLATPILTAPPFFSVRLGLSMVVMLVAAAVISVVFVGRMTDPLRQLSRAAEKLGMDVQASAIPETGPQEVRRTAQAFNVMQNRIRRFVKDRTQMLGAIAHDLGTPITRLRLRAEFVEDQELRRKMLRDLDDMQQMVASTLSFIREEADTESQVKVDIGSLLARVCDDIMDAGFDVELADIPRRLLLKCQPVALRRALSNVIDNAVKYGEQARVSVRLEPNNLIIVVEDIGPGIKENRQEDVFRPFLRLEESRNRETGGTGLGLSVARTILHGHGGDISLKNRPEGGLRVELRLPLIEDLQSSSAPAVDAELVKIGLLKSRITGERTTKWKML